MIKLIFILFLSNGTIQENEGLYTVHTDAATYENACKGEVMQWIESGNFEYNDFLCDCGELE